MMKRYALVAFLGFASVAPAIAGETVERAPPSEWVLPMPEGSRPAGASSVVAGTEAPVRILAIDQQVRIDGTTTSRYFQSVVKLQTAEGLQAGNVTLVWRPEQDRIVVHHLRIRRGDEVIDVLGGGQAFTVVRRETNLEQSTLDGMLTATLQPEGLQVGDVIELAMTTISVDPVLADNAQFIDSSWNEGPIDRARTRISWPRGQRVQHRERGGIGPAREVTRDGWTSIELRGDGLEPFAPPAGAPGRYTDGRLLSVSGFADWPALSRLMAPYYTAAARLAADSPLRAEIARIAAVSDDPVVRTEAALTLVQDRVRYVALLSGLGNLVPADADRTWSRRFGDCKGKTALLLALLAGLGVEAQPVIVNASGLDSVDSVVPMVSVFNHVVVRATIAGKRYWLDGTRRGDRRLSVLRVPYLGRVLPVTDAGSPIEHIVPPPLDAPASTLSLAYDGTRGLQRGVPLAATLALQGDVAIGMNTGLSAMTPSQRTTQLGNLWRNQMADLSVGATSYSYDADAQLLTLTMTGTVDLDWDNRNWRPFNAGIGWRPDFNRPAGQDRDAAWFVAFPRYNQVQTRVKLPAGIGGFSIVGDPDVDVTVAGMTLRRSARLADGLFTLTSSTRANAPEMPASEVPAATASLRLLQDKDLTLVAPVQALAIGVATPATTANGAASAANQPQPPGSAAELVRQADARADASDLGGARTLLGQAILVSSGTERDTVQIGRAELAFNSGDAAAAEADVAAVLARAPQFEPALKMRASLEQFAGRGDAAIATITDMLARNPQSGDLLVMRANLHRRAGHLDRALADVDAAITAAPANAEHYLTRANFLKAMGQRDRATQVATQLTEALPDDPYAWVVAARILASAGETARAEAAFDRAIAIEPAAYIYLNRANARPLTARAERLADLDRALAMEPTMTEALQTKVDLQLGMGDTAAARTTLDAAIAAVPTDMTLVHRRGILSAKAGDDAGAARDFDTARAAATVPMALNNLCYDKVVANVALPRALAECDAAVAALPVPNILDSLGWARLRSGNARGAIEMFDRVLATTPDMANSLYGRAVAWRSVGDLAKARADRNAALAIDREIARRWEADGVPLIAD